VYPSPRSRSVYALLLVLTVAAGLGSRRYGAHLPPFVAAYAGDTLWALSVFLIVALLAPRRPTVWIAAVALALSYADEFSQLYRALWLDAVRATMPGALLLGHGFLWSDLACYTAGVAVGAGAELLALRSRPER
jgi:hypothetical protein